MILEFFFLELLDGPDELSLSDLVLGGFGEGRFLGFFEDSLAFDRSKRARIDASRVVVG